MSATVLPFRKGMESAGNGVEQFIASSLSDYVRENGKRPDGVIVCWIGEDGEVTTGWDQAGRYELAFAAAYLSRLAVEDGEL